MIVIMEDAPPPFLPSTLLVHETSFSSSPRLSLDKLLSSTFSTGSTLGKGSGSADHGGSRGASLAHIALQGVSVLARVTAPPCIVLPSSDSSLGVDGCKAFLPTGPSPRGDDGVLGVLGVWWRLLELEVLQLF